MSRDRADDRVVVPLHGVHRSGDVPNGAERHPSAAREADVLDFGAPPPSDATVPETDSAGIDSAGIDGPKISGAKISGPEIDVPAVAAPARVAAQPLGWEQKLTEALAFVRRRLEGDYPVDEFGFDPELTEQIALPAIRALYERWFRVEVNGVANLPDTGGALLVANHAGGLWPMDAAMTAAAVHLEHPRGRFLRPLGADLLFGTPGVGTFARRTGATLACHDDADRLLRAGELVGVWPEGFKGIGKPFRERYQLQRFGRGGFVRSAITAGVPIIPVSIVGSEEIHPVLANAKLLARLFDLPYFPITPTFPWLGPLGLVPLPSKWYIEFGTPIGTDGLVPAVADDPSVIFEITDEVRETIQSTLYRLLAQRRSVWR